MKTGLRQNKYLFPLLLAANLLFALCVIYVGHPFYETNDEYGISSLYAGVYGMATANGVFPNVLLGSVLKLASALCPGVDWLWVTMVGATVLSFSVVGWALLRAAGQRGIVPYLVIVGVCGCRFYILWNFTRTAAFSAAAGCAALLLLLRIPSRRWNDFVPGILLVWFGWLLRLKSGEMATALGAMAVAILAARPTIHAVCTKDKAFLSRHKPEMEAAGTLVLALLLSLSVQKIAEYATPGWNSYAAYNAVRAEAMDYPIADYGGHAEEYAALGITDEDRSLIKGWCFADYERITTDTFRGIRAIEVDKLPLKEKLRYDVEVLQELLSKRTLLLLSVVVLAVCLVLIRRLSLLATAALAVGTALLYFVLVSGGRYPPRVLDGLDATLVLLLLAVQPWPGSGEKKLQRNPSGLPVSVPAVATTALALLAGALLGTALLRDNADLRPNVLTPEESTAARDELAQKLDPHILYLRDAGSAVNYAAFYPIGQMPSAGTEHNLLYLGGWEVQSPQYNEVLSDYGVQNPIRALAEQDNVMLLDYNVMRVRAKQDYLRRYYNPTLHWSVVDTVLEQPMVAFATLPQGALPAASGASLAIAAASPVGQEDLYTLTGTLQGLPPEPSVCSLLLRGADGTEHCFRFLPLRDGTSFALAVPAELLPDGNYTVTALCKTQGAASYTWQSLPATLSVADASA